MQIRAKEMINETWEGLEDPAVFIMRVRRFTILPPTIVPWDGCEWIFV
jgi:hypothetical protein